MTSVIQEYTDQCFLLSDVTRYEGQKTLEEGIIDEVKRFFAGLSGQTLGDAIGRIVGVGTGTALAV